MISTLILAAATQDSPASALFQALGGPWITQPFWVAVTLLLGYALTLWGSGYVVRYFVAPATASMTPDAKPGTNPRFDPGAVIGKCENIITLSLVLLDQVAGLAIIFAGKSLVRKEKIEQDAGYYLGGTLVNLVWSVMVGFILRILIVGR